MSELEAALMSLYDSLNGLFMRMAKSNSDSLWIARIMLRIGQILQDVDLANASAATVSRTHQYAGNVSMCDPADADALESLLSEIEDFLASL